jgi:hypothetical protein
MLVLLIAAAKILAVKVGTSVDLACLPCWNAYIVLCLLLAFSLVEEDFW